MNKRTLMLSAAAAALLSAPAMAATTISTANTASHKTSTDGDLTVDAAGSITFKSETVPIITIDSSNTFSNAGALVGSAQTSETAILIDTTAAALTGSFTNTGNIDLSGAGVSKKVLYMSGANGFTGNITFDSGTVSLVGDNSTGILFDANTILNGNLLLGGTFTVSSTTANSAGNSGIALARLLGTIHGNVVIGTGAGYAAAGNGAQGITLVGHIMSGPGGAIGSFVNSGTLTVGGVSTRSSTTANAESGPALVIGNSVDGGVLNNGPTVYGDTTAIAVISGNGTGSGSAVVVIAPQTTAVGIILGKDTADSNAPDYSFINRGTISASPIDPNLSSTDIIIGGNAAAHVHFNGGFFTSGLISASAQSTVGTQTSQGSAVSAVALEIDSYVEIPEIRVSAQSVNPSGQGTTGVIAAAIDGPLGGVASAILITGQPVSSVTVTTVPLITIEKGARVIASASVTDPSSTDVASLAAIGIRDISNSLATINNAGTISATATVLTNGIGTSVAHAVDVSLNSQGLTFNNTGTVVGDVLFGTGNDTYTVQGANLANAATHTGDISFNTGTDQLVIGQFANVAGTIVANGQLDVQVGGNQSFLTVRNVATTLNTRIFHVDGTATPGSTGAGTVNITVSQALGTTAVIAATTSATLDAGANLSVAYGSFIPAGGNFTLISAPTGQLFVTPGDIATYSAAIGDASHLPFLFNSATIQRVNNYLGQGKDILQLSVSAKTVTQLGITGYGKAMFPLANTALVSDGTLGAAMVTGITDQASAQAAYDAFAPDVSGGARSIAVSLTDQATGVVAARQRTLRLFGKQPGDLTLWGNEFGEYIATKGGTVSAADPLVINSGFGNGFKDHGFGFSVGLDEGSPHAGWYGAAFTFYTGDIAEGGDRTAKTSTLWYLLTGYTDWRGKGLFVDSQVTVGYGSFKGKRFINLTLPGGSVFTREADSKRAGLVGAIGLTMGANMKYGATSIIPQLSIDGMSMREEGFTEVNGGTGFNLTVKPYYANSLRVFLGTEFREDINVGDFFLQPSLRLGYRYDLLNDPVKLHAAFADINGTLAGNQPGTAFTLQGPDPARGNYVAGFNIGATTENWTIGLNYDFVRGSNNATEQVGTISLLGRI